METTMESTRQLPEFTIPTVLSHLRTRDIGRCACISKAWAVWVDKEPIASKLNPVRARGKMSEMQKSEIDWNLMQAALGGNADAVESLLAKGACLEARDFFSFTPLMLAALSCSQPTVNLLISEGAQVDAINMSESSALMFASRNGQVPILNILISSGADLNLVDHRGKTAILWAQENGNIEAIRILREAGAKE